MVIITFFIGDDLLQKSTSGAVGRKWNGSPLLVIGTGPSCAANRVSRISQEKGIEDLEGIKCIDSVPLPRGLHIQDPFVVVVDLELF